jgi:hypothetical protein
MSDQYTRITCGGSPLDKTAPVVGLLFGNVDGDGVLQLKDADDIPTDLSETSILQVDLHRAVFPQHNVVGWYRVSKEEEPTPNDLKVTQQLQQHYHCHPPEEKDTETPTLTQTQPTPPPPPPQMPLIFCLLQVQTQTTQSESNKQDDDEDAEAAHNLTQELPINLYELHTTTSTSSNSLALADDDSPTPTATTSTTILLGLSHWDLETSDPERIAVERVMREQPLEANQASTFCTQSQSVQHSLSSMKDRIAYLVSFLQDTAQGKIDPHYSLLRDVQGLVYSLGPLAAATRDCDESQDALLLSHLAAVAKTTSAVQSYTDKFRLLQENRALGKELRRAF